MGWGLCVACTHSRGVCHDWAGSSQLDPFAPNFGTLNQARSITHSLKSRDRSPSCVREPRSWTRRSGEAPPFERPPARSRGAHPQPRPPRCAHSLQSAVRGRLAHSRQTAARARALTSSAPAARRFHLRQDAARRAVSRASAQQVAAACRGACLAALAHARRRQRRPR